MPLLLLILGGFWFFACPSSGPVFTKPSSTCIRLLFNIVILILSEVEGEESPLYYRIDFLTVPTYTFTLLRKDFRQKFNCKLYNGNFIADCTLIILENKPFELGTVEVQKTYFQRSQFEIGEGKISCQKEIRTCQQQEQQVAPRGIELLLV